MTARLWLALVAGHVAWSAHLLVGYFLAAQACLGSDSAMWVLRNVLSLLALVVTAIGMAAAFVERRHASNGVVVSERRFLAQLALVLSTVFLFAIALASSASLVVVPCA